MARDPDPATLPDPAEKTYDLPAKVDAKPHPYSAVLEAVDALADLEDHERALHRERDAHRERVIEIEDKLLPDLTKRITEMREAILHGLGMHLTRMPEETVKEAGRYDPRRPNLVVDAVTADQVERFCDDCGKYRRTDAAAHCVVCGRGPL